VGVSDYLPSAIWTLMFMAGQGHRLNESWLQQDNESAINFETNGWHCPTLEMLADLLPNLCKEICFNGSAT
jgi:hypothetical protein